METVYLLGAFQCLFYVFLIIWGKSLKFHQVLLIAFFIFLATILFGQFFLVKGLVFTYPHLLGITYPVPLLIGPVILLYTLVLINKVDRKISLLNLLHLIPFAIVTTYLLYDYYFLTGSEKLKYFIEQTETTTSVFFFVAEILLYFSLPLYAVISLVYLFKHTKKIKQSFSTLTDKNLQWLNIILYTLIALSLISFITGLLSDIYHFISFRLAENILYTSLTIVIYFFGFFGIKQKPVLVQWKSEQDNPVQKLKYADSSFKDEDKNIHLQKLLSLMETERPFLNENISLKELAEIVEISPNNLSQLINEKLKKNFFEFINEYRVEEVKKLLTNEKYSNYSILGIAYECGFNSKSTFNNIFKKNTGLTPTEYRRSLKLV